MRHALMTLSLLLVATTASAEAVKAIQPNKPALIKRIKKACLKSLASPDKDVKPDKNPTKVCDCVAENLGRKFGLADLELLTRSHEDDKKAEAELQNDKHAPLLHFDAEVIAACRKDHGWKFKP